MKYSQKGFMSLLTLVLITIFGLTSIGTVLASENSNPGDTLFPVKEIIDSIRPQIQNSGTAVDEINDDNIKIEKKKLHDVEVKPESINFRNNGEIEIRGREAEGEDHLRGGEDEIIHRNGDDSRVGGEVELRGKETEEDHSNDDNREAVNRSDDAKSSDEISRNSSQTEDNHDDKKEDKGEKD